jgi:hypothetical protein
MNKDTELLTRVGPGTPIGELMRQYWLPAALSTEVSADRAPSATVRRTTQAKALAILLSQPGRPAAELAQIRCRVQRGCADRTSSLAHLRGQILVELQ